MLFDRDKQQMLMLYQHFDRDDMVDPHILYQLGTIHDFGIRIIFISNSNLSASELKKLDGIAEKCILRKNCGFDFGAWQNWLCQNKQEVLQNYNRLILMNCSCYGPLFPQDNLFQTMEQKECDFWGLTDYRSDGKYPVHLQSNFMVFKKSVLLSEPFWNFWQEQHDFSSFDKTIRHGEIMLSQVLLHSGFHFSAYCSITGISPDWALNFVQSYSFSIPDFLIAHYMVPFVKIKGFISDSSLPFSKAGKILRAIKESGSRYPVQLIIDHQRRTEPLSWQKNLPDTLLVSSTCGKKQSDLSSVRLAVIVQMTDERLIPELSRYLPNIPCNFDLQISTPNVALQKTLEERLRLKNGNLRKIAIRQGSNAGSNDVYEWLNAFSDQQQDYDLILKYRPEDLGDASNYVTSNLKRHLLDSLIGTPTMVENLLNSFLREPQLGIVFSTYPTVLMLKNAHAFADYPAEAVRSCVSRYCGEHLPPAESGIPVYPFGNMFWYRPAAIKNLLQSAETLDPKQLQSLVIALPYIMQGNGFYFKLSISQDLLAETFQLYEDKLMSHSWDENDSRIEQLTGKIQSMEQSLSWKITKPIRACSSFFKKVLKRGQ